MKSAVLLAVGCSGLLAFQQPALASAELTLGLGLGLEAQGGWRPTQAFSFHAAAAVIAEGDTLDVIGVAPVPETYFSAWAAYHLGGWQGFDGGAIAGAHLATFAPSFSPAALMPALGGFVSYTAGPWSVALAPTIAFSDGRVVQTPSYLFVGPPLLQLAYRQGHFVAALRSSVIPLALGYGF